jgi:hypothetical protein
MTGFFFRKSRKIESQIAVLEFFPYPEPYELKKPVDRENIYFQVLYGILK